MIGSLARIGKELLEQDAHQGEKPRDALIKRLIEKKAFSRNEEQKIAPVVFDLKSKKCYVGSDVKQVNEANLERYMYIFEWMHPKRPRPRLVFKSLKNLSQNLDISINKIEQLEKTGKASESMLKLHETLVEARRFITNLEPPDKDTVLYRVTVLKNGEVLELTDSNSVWSEGYKDLLYTDIRMEDAVKKGTCHLCNSNTDVLIDPDFPAGSFLKVYITDQPGFLSGIPLNELQRDHSLLKSFTMCPDCLSHVLVGYKFIEQNDRLSSRMKLSNMRTFIIPRSNAPIRKIERWVKYLGDRWSASSSYIALSRLDERLRDYTDEESLAGSYYLTVIFGRKGRADFKFFGAIREAPVTRLAIYAEKARQLKRIFTERLGVSNDEIYPGFENIERIVPLRLRKNEILDPNPLISIYEAILKGHSISRSALYGLALTVASIHYYGTDLGYTVKPRRHRSTLPRPSRSKYTRSSSVSPVRDLCKAVILYKALERIMAVMNGGVEITSSEGGVLPEHLESWLNELGYEEWQKPLFLLGYVMGEIGAWQKGGYKREGFPPILNKLSFDGMSKVRLKQLCLDIAESMKNYEIRSKDVLIAWSKAQIDLDKHLGKMNDPISNSYHILSGYAYATLRRLTGKAKEEPGVD